MPPKPMLKLTMSILTGRLLGNEGHDESMNNRPIGIFDSGAGGLSILLEIKRLLPNEPLTFMADQFYAPYGAKTKDELVDRVTKVMEFFQTKNVKTVVMACNTATVYTLQEMRDKFDFPIIGVVPVVKTLANISKTKKAAVFATPATAQSPYLDDLIQQFAGDVEIKKVEGGNLAAMVDTGKLDSPEIRSVLQEKLSPLVEQGVDAIALGCTQYPFLRKQIEQIVGEGIVVVDSGGAVARRLKAILGNENLLADGVGSEQYFTTGDAGKFHVVAEQLMQRPLPMVSHVEI